eukprot:Opistho-2@20595
MRRAGLSRVKREPLHAPGCSSGEGNQSVRSLASFVPPRRAAPLFDHNEIFTKENDEGVHSRTSSGVDEATVVKPDRTREPPSGVASIRACQRAFKAENGNNEANLSGSFAAISHQRGVGGLNEPQRRAVEHTSGALVVLAGPGSGKTQVLCRRTAWLVETTHTRPESLLLLTFSNKAAKEMRTRLGRFVSADVVARIPIGTFHAISVAYLRQYGSKIGVTRDFGICDDDCRRKVIKEALDGYVGKEERRRLAGVLGQVISSCKGSGKRLVDANMNDVAVQLSMSAVAATEILARYDALLAAQNKLDFDDLLVRALELIVATPSLAQAISHVLVDEFQDTNVVQCKLAIALASASGNITIVGDPNQTIYEWRGASAENFSRIGESFSGRTVVRLVDNYRSQSSIVACANAIVRGKCYGGLDSLQMRASGHLSGVVQPVAMLSLGRDTSSSTALPRDEAGVVLAELRRLSRALPGLMPKHFAVLLRTNSMTRPFEEAFVRSGVPYRLLGGTRFLEREEVKDCLAYLAFVCNKADIVAFSRAVQVPNRGFGKKSIAALRSHCASAGISFADAFVPTHRAGVLAKIGAAQRSGVAEFLDTVDALDALLDRDEPLSLVYAEMIRLARLEEHYAKSSQRDSQGSQSSERVGNIQLGNAVREFEGRLATERTLRMRGGAAVRGLASAPRRT